MLTQLLEFLKLDEQGWKETQLLFTEQKYKSKTILLSEGDVANNIFFIKKGLLRLSYNNDGRDISFQFFIENEAAASLDSFIKQQPSLYTLECIEKTTVVVLHRSGFDKLLQNYPQLQNDFNEIITERMMLYERLLLSRIKDNPQKRYDDLMKNNPHLFNRVPQHHLASYLGITPTSLCRIKNKFCDLIVEY